MPTVWGSGVLSARMDCTFALPFPFAEEWFGLVDGFALFVDEEDGDGETAEGGGGGGLAYSSVHCRAFWSWIERLRRNSVAMDGTNGSEGLGSVRRELSESTTLKMDSAGDQLFLRMSMQTFPLSEIFM